MKKITKNILSILITFLITSCSSDYEESMEETKECLEDKYDDKKSNYESIDAALSAYDFESARVLLSCYEDACFPYGTRSTNCPEKNYTNTFKEVAERKANENPYFKQLYKTIKSEVTYLLKIGEFGQAKNSAIESDLFFVYKQALPNGINNLIDLNKQLDAIAILSKYTFNQSYDLSESSYSNQGYNLEANMFNDMVNSVFNNALFNENKVLLKKCLLLYVPLCEKKDSKSCKLSHTYKQTAMSKIKEASITL